MGAIGYLLLVKAFGRVFGVKEMMKFCNQGWRAKLKNTAGLKVMLGQIAADALIISPVTVLTAHHLHEHSRDHAYGCGWGGGSGSVTALPLSATAPSI